MCSSQQRTLRQTHVTFNCTGVRPVEYVSYLVSTLGQLPLRDDVVNRTSLGASSIKRESEAFMMRVVSPMRSERVPDA